MRGFASWDTLEVTQHQLVLRLLAAMVLGGPIGAGALLQRERRRRLVDAFGDD